MSGNGTPMMLPAPAASVGLGDVLVGHVQGGFGGAVHVDDLWGVIAIAVEPGLQGLQVQRFTAEQDVAQREGPGGRGVVGVDERLEAGGGLRQHGDVFAFDQGAEGGGVAAGVVGDDDEAATHQQRAPEF